jgi:transposase
MLKKDKYKLTEAELAVVEAAMKSQDAKVQKRATALHLLHLGNTPSEVAAMLLIERGTLYQWINRWQSEGEAGLVDHAGRGRKRKATPEYLEALAATLEQAPHELGYAFAIWTVDRLRAHLAQVTGIELSCSRLRALMKEQGYGWRRPKHDLRHLQDPAARAAAQEQLEALKKGRWEGITSSSLWTKPH